MLSLGGGGGGGAAYVNNLYISLTHGAEPFSSSRQLCSYSRTSRHFMELRSQEPYLHWSLSWARSIQSISSHTLSLTSILIFSTHLCLGLPSGLFPSSFHTNTLYAFLLSTICATWPACLILLDLITLIMLGEEYKLWSSSLCSFLHPPLWKLLERILETILKWILER
jgi:hypothetical protein